MIGIKLGAAKSDSLQSDPGSNAHGQRSDKDSRFRALLRIVDSLRDDASPDSVIRRKRAWEEILGAEIFRIREMVSVRGYAQTGGTWVDKDDVDDVTADACIRATRMFEGFRGTSPGELYNALATCVKYAVADYVRRDERRPETAVDPREFEPGSHDRSSDSSPLGAGIHESAFGADYVELIDALGRIAQLEARDRRVMAMRISGHSSAEVATELGLTAANVDQIFSRTIKSLRKGLKDD